MRVDKSRVAISERDRERIDDMLMDLGDVGPLRFIVPSECRPKHGTRGTSTDTMTPGVWLAQLHCGVSPRVQPRTKRPVRLSWDQALDMAALLDRLAGDAIDPHDSAGFPASYTSLVIAFKEALGRRLSRAVDATNDRHLVLRELRASLTGEMST